MFDLILQAFGVLFLVSLATYFIPFLIISWRSPQNLAKKYPGAQWAMVTGGSSGIGRAIVERLASQGNVATYAPCAQVNGYKPNENDIFQLQGLTWLSWPTQMPCLSLP